MSVKKWMSSKSRTRASVGSIGDVKEVSKYRNRNFNSAFIFVKRMCDVLAAALGLKRSASMMFSSTTPEFRLSRCASDSRRLSGLCIVAVMTAASAFPAFAADPPPESLTPDQVKSEIERLKTEADTLKTSPDAPAAYNEAVALEGRLVESYKQQQEMHHQLEALGQKPEVAEWNKRIRAVYVRLNGLMYRDASNARDAGVKLSKARQEELAKVPTPNTPQLRGFGFDVLTYPRLDGSTSTHPLSVLIASMCFGLPSEWFGKAEAPREYYRGLDYNIGMYVPGRFSNPEFDLCEFTMWAKSSRPGDERLAAIVNRLLAINASTHESYVNLAEGRRDIGLLARLPSHEEIELARTKGIEYETAPIALDAFVFLVNEDNPVKALTSAQIRDIYSGKVNKWDAVGGPAQPLTAYQREAQSGSQELMLGLVMKDVPMVKSTGDTRVPNLIAPGMGGPYIALTRDRNGVAYSVYYYEHYMAGSARTKLIAVDGIEPSQDTIRQRSYPYISEVYVVTLKGLPSDSGPAKLRDWLRSSEGQAVVRKSGYIPIGTHP